MKKFSGVFVAVFLGVAVTGLAQLWYPWNMEFGLGLGTSPTFTQAIVGLRTPYFSLGIALASVNNQGLLGAYGSARMPLRDRLSADILEYKTFWSKDAEWVELKLRVPILPWAYSGMRGFLYAGGKFSVLSISAEGEQQYLKQKGLLFGKEFLSDWYWSFAPTCLPRHCLTTQTYLIYMELQFMFQSMPCDGCPAIKPNIEAGIRFLF